jgi:hypothetical protein
MTATVGDVASGGATVYTPIGVADVAARALLHFDGADDATTTTDSSANALTVTLVGTAKLKTTSLKFGSTGLYLDGSGYAKISSSALLNLFGSGNDALISMWVKPSAGELAGAATCTLWQHYQDANNFFCLQHDNDGNSGSLRLIVKTGGVNHVLLSTGASALAEGSYQQVDVVRRDGEIHIIVDGVIKASANYTGTHTWTGDLFIGTQTGGTDNIVGSIDEFRMATATASLVRSAAWQR